MSGSKYGFEKTLTKWLKDAEKAVIVGIGNPIRTDDYVGMKVVQDLTGKVSDRVLLVEAETVPENFADKIISFDPTHVLLIDAAVLGLEPAQVRLMSPEKLLDFPAFSTHMMPIRVFCDYIATSTKADVALLLIEPKETGFGERLSPEVSDVTDRIVAVLERSLQRL